MRKLLLEMDRLMIKVCGLRDNVTEVVALRPNYVGFIFYPRSPRYVGKDFEMPAIDDAIRKVGVYVNETERSIMDTVRKYQLDFVQLHGDESPEMCLSLKSHAIGVIKAFRLDSSFDFSELERYEDVVDYFLFDTKTDTYGGSGERFDWQLLSNYHLDKAYFLSGGIGLENFGEVKQVDLDKVHAIDVNSRFEVSPGLKDIRLLSKLMDKFADMKVQR